jgi:hypothetical protein
VASVSVLYVADAVVGPHLELLRRVCEPWSSSKPHITDVIAPGSFGVNDEWSQSNRTVYLRCESDELLGLEHKPHFPSSFFHVTVYDGRSLEFARSLLAVLSRFEWGFRVPLPKSTTLSKVEIKPRAMRKKGRRRPYSAEGNFA